MQLLISFPEISKLILGQHIVKNALHQCYHLILIMCLAISANPPLDDVIWWTSIWFAIFPLSLIWSDALQRPSSMHPTLLWWIYYWPNWLDCLPCTTVKPVQKTTYMRQPLTGFSLLGGGVPPTSQKFAHSPPPGKFSPPSRLPPNQIFVPPPTKGSSPPTK